MRGCEAGGNGGGEDGGGGGGSGVSGPSAGVHGVPTTEVHDTVSEEPVKSAAVVAAGPGGLYNMLATSSVTM